MKTNKRIELEALSAAISRVNGIYNQWASKQGLHLPTMWIFYKLYTRETMTQKQICDSFEMPKQTVNSTIKTMINDGYVTLMPSEHDKREKIATLTELGQKRAMALLHPLFSIEEKVVNAMGQKRVQQLIDATIEYGDILNKEIAKL